MEKPIWKTDLNQRGLVLLEFILIIFIICMIAFPAIKAYSHSKAVAADKIALIQLNSATVYYALGEEIKYDDIFKGQKTHNERLDELLKKGYIQTIPKPRDNEMQFTWDSNQKHWELSILSPGDER